LGNNEPTFRSTNHRNELAECFDISLSIIDTNVTPKSASFIVRVFSLRGWALMLLIIEWGPDWGTPKSVQNLRSINYEFGIAKVRMKLRFMAQRTNVVQLISMRNSSNVSVRFVTAFNLLWWLQFMQLQLHDFNHHHHAVNVHSLSTFIMPAECLITSLTCKLCPKCNITKMPMSVLAQHFMLTACWTSFMMLLSFIFIWRINLMMSCITFELTVLRLMNVQIVSLSRCN